MRLPIAALLGMAFMGHPTPLPEVLIRKNPTPETGESVLRNANNIFQARGLRQIDYDRIARHQANEAKKIKTTRRKRTRKCEYMKARRGY